MPAGIISIDALRSRQVITGGNGPSSPTNIIPQLLNLCGGKNYKVVAGYRGLGKILVSMDEGEVQAMVGNWVSFKTSFARRAKAGKAKVFVQMAPKRHRKLMDVPTAAEMVLMREGKAVANFVASSAGIGRVLSVPRCVPQAGIATPQTVFSATVKDPLFLAEVKMRNSGTHPADHMVREKIVTDTLARAPAVFSKAAEIAQGGEEVTQMIGR